MVNAAKKGPHNMTDLEHRVALSRWSRRRLLRAAVASAAALVLAASLPVAAAEPDVAETAGSGKTTSLSDHLFVYHGPVNVGIVRDGDRALLIDCGDGSVAAELSKLNISTVDQVVFTHYHRDQVCGLGDVAPEAKVGAPAGERDLLADPAGYWNDAKNLYRVYRTFRPDHLVPAEPIEVHEEFADGDRFTFGPAKVRVIDTPGHTEGSVSYLVEIDGRRVVFCGDSIYDEGRVWDVYSLQKGFKKGQRQIGGYHGFMGDRPRLVESLERIKGLEPDLLVPSHGNLMPEVARAVDELSERFEACYENYVSISALRHYFPELFTDYEGRPGQMPIRPGIEPPDCLRHHGTTWMLVSESGAAFVMDVGSPRIVDQIRKMLAEGQIKSVEGLWVTHYHYDHTAGIPEFQKEFDCPCFMDRRLADVLTDPTAWRLPCLMADPIRVDRPMEDGQSWTWREFEMTSYYYPGQTLYHDALFVQKGGLKMLFVGDSHTMAGIDDYCAQNRNWLGRDVGFQYCISLIERLEPTHIFNCHVADAFTFTPDEIRFMRKALDRREELFGQLVPWDHANYGLDASWVRCHPYVNRAVPGERVRLEVVLTNHSAKPQQSACRAVMPRALGGKATNWVHGEAGPKAEHRLPVSVEVPAGAPAGRYVVAIDVRHGQRRLPQFAEAIVDVGE